MHTFLYMGNGDIVIVPVTACSDVHPLPKNLMLQSTITLKINVIGKGKLFVHSHIHRTSLLTQRLPFKLVSLILSVCHCIPFADLTHYPIALDYVFRPVRFIYFDADILFQVSLFFIVLVISMLWKFFMRHLARISIGNNWKTDYII